MKKWAASYSGEYFDGWGCPTVGYNEK